MPKAKLYRFDALDAGPEEIEVPAEVFGGPVHKDLLYRAVRVFLANQRQGTAKAKTRGEVSGGGRKPWRQKGTGRARHGSIRSPIWRHGGVTFGPRAHKVRLSLPKRMRRKALISALSARFKEGGLVVIDRLGFPRPRTKEGITLLRKLECPERTLVVVAPDEYRVPVVKSFSNIPGVSCMRSDFLSAYHVLAHEGLLVTKGALDALAGRLQDV